MPKEKSVITIKDLKPCPFCGRDEGADSYNEDKNIVIRCMNCGAVGPWADSLRVAIENWNKRFVFVFGYAEYLEEED